MKNPLLVPIKIPTELHVSPRQVADYVRKTAVESPNHPHLKDAHLIADSLHKWAMELMSSVKVIETMLQQ